MDVHTQTHNMGFKINFFMSFFQYEGVQSTFCNWYYSKEKAFSNVASQDTVKMKAVSP